MSLSRIEKTSKSYKSYKSRKSGQAAVEFLLTYGWAMLAVLVMVGALSYFGFLSPSAFLPEKCEFMVGLSCRDFQLKSNAVMLSLGNAFGEEIVVSSLELIDPESASTVCKTAVDGVMKNGELRLFSFPCSFSQTDTKMNLRVRVNYAKRLGDAYFPHRLTGILYANVAETSCPLVQQFPRDLCINGIIVPGSPDAQGCPTAEVCRPVVSGLP